MKKTIKLASLLLALTASIASAGGEKWMTDFEAAKKKAATENKDLLVDFTGSDWCGWCIKLVDEVFKHDAFNKGVADKFILVELDFPSNKSKIDAATQKQNKTLQKAYSIKGYPTILLMDAKGRPYAQTGYREGGPEKYLEHLNELQKLRVKRDASLSAANKLKGKEKAKALLAVLKTVPKNQVNHYSGIIDEITKLDPKDDTGFLKEMKLKKARQKLTMEVGSLMPRGKNKEALSLIDKFAVDHQLKGKEKQELLSMKIGILLNSKKFDETTKLVDELIALDPATQIAKRLTQFKPNIQKIKERATKAKKPIK